jgi:hypothetical protein
MGPLEARGVAEGDRTSFWKTVIVDLFSGGTAWWDSSCRAAALKGRPEKRKYSREFGSNMGNPGIKSVSG